MLINDLVVGYIGDGGKRLFLFEDFLRFEIKLGTFVDIEVLNCCLSSDAARNGFNFSRWRNQTFDALLQTAVQNLNIDERTQLYLKAQKIFKQEQPFTPIAYVTDY